jgi:hypothetical protein
VRGQSAKYASPAYGVASYSTRSPENSVRSCGSQTIVSPFVCQPHLELAEPKRHFTAERHRRPRQSGHAFDGLEEAREALDLALHVLRAALDDQIVRIRAGDDFLRRVARGAEHAHRVIVRQQHVPDREVGDAADAPQHVLRHHRRRLCIGDQHGVVADHDAGVRIAFGRVGVRVFRQAIEADRLFLHVRTGRKGLRHREFLGSAARGDAAIRYYGSSRFGPDPAFHAGTCHAGTSHRRNTRSRRARSHQPAATDERAQ